MGRSVLWLLSLSLLLLARAQEEVTCSGDEVTVDPVSQGKVDKILGTILKRPRLIAGIRRAIKDPNHWIRKWLKSAAQDVTDPEAADVGPPTDAIPMGLVGLVGKLIGPTKTVVGYLWQYGFIAKILNKSKNEADNYNGNIPPCGVTNAVIAFQVFNQINPPNGKLTKETIDKMAEDRCGNGDVKCTTPKCITDDRKNNRKDNDVMRKKRYVVRNKKWRISRGGKYYLGYYFENYYNAFAPDKEGHDKNMGRDVVRREVEKGLQEWTKYAGINFIEVKNPKNAHVKIRFGSGLHGEKNEKNAFDGPYGVLAHMYYPRNGKMHFDEAENYTASELRKGINLFSVAAHEMGHGLGLEHSEIKAALMSPYYKGYREEMLDWDDVNGIRRLYGKGQGSVSPLQGPVYNPPVKYLNTETVSADAYAAKGNNKFDPSEPEDQSGSEAESTEQEFEDTTLRECVEYFELAFSDPTGEFIYMFYNTDKYIRITSGDKNMPLVEAAGEDFVHRLVAEEFPGLEGPFEAAVTYKDTTYFFAAGTVTSWDWNHGTLGALQEVPLEESGFKGVPLNVDAVGRYHDQLVFFSGDRYYVYDAVHGLVENEAGEPTSGDGEEVAASFDSYYNGYLYTVMGEGRNNNIYNLLNARKVLVHGISFEEAVLEAYSWIEMDEDTMFGWPKQLEFCVGIPDANEEK